MGRRLKTTLRVGVVVAMVVVVAGVALVYAASLRVGDALKGEIARRLPAAASSLGLSIRFDDISLSPITGLSLKGVSLSAAGREGVGPTLAAEAVKVMYSVHLLRSPRITVDGVRLVRPSLKLAERTLAQAASVKLLGKTLKGESGRRFAAKFQLSVEDLSIEYWRLSDRRMEGVDLTLDGMAMFDADEKLIDFDRLDIAFGGISFSSSGSVMFADGLVLDTKIRSGRMPIQSFLDAVPGGFIPILDGARVGGTIGIEIDFAMDSKKLSSLKFDPKIKVEDFEILRAPRYVDIEKLKRPFEHRIKRDGKVVKEFLVGHPNYWFVPYKRFGENAIKGVLTCEDGSFFRHDGFQVKHLRESLIQDIREERFARGGSTITMQTAKNLFLSGRKDLSRKFQEMLIAYAMEQVLSKERILEIYMNIIEWGPDIYGIGSASKHYFDKWPKDLTPVEAAFLGSIIPSARRYHYMYKMGFVSDQWETYLALIVSKMGVTGEAYDEILSFQPEFGWVRKEREAKEISPRDDQ